MRQINNPLRRCCLCNGREILIVDDNDTVIESSLQSDTIPNKFVCKDTEECHRNRYEESTDVNIELKENSQSYTITTPDGISITTEVNKK